MEHLHQIKGSLEQPVPTLVFLIIYKLVVLVVLLPTPLVLLDHQDFRFMQRGPSILFNKGAGLLVHLLLVHPQNHKIVSTV